MSTRHTPTRRVKSALAIAAAVAAVATLLGAPAADAAVAPRSIAAAPVEAASAAATTAAALPAASPEVYLPTTSRGWFKKQFKSIKKTVKKVGKAVEKAATNVRKGIVRAAEDVGTWAKKAAKAVAKATRDAARAAAKAVKRAGDAAAKAARDASRAVAKAAKDVSAAVAKAGAHLRKFLKRSSRDLNRFTQKRIEEVNKTVWRLQEAINKWLAGKAVVIYEGDSSDEKEETDEAKGEQTPEVPPPTTGPEFAAVEATSKDAHNKLVRDLDDLTKNLSSPARRVQKSFDNFNGSLSRLRTPLDEWDRADLPADVAKYASIVAFGREALKSAASLLAPTRLVLAELQSGAKAARGSATLQKLAEGAQARVTAFEKVERKFTADVEALQKLVDRANAMLDNK